MEVLQKLKNRTIIWPSSFTSGYTDRRNEISLLKTERTLVLTVTLLTIVKIWYQFKCSPVGEVIHTEDKHSGILFTI